MAVSAMRHDSYYLRAMSDSEGLLEGLSVVRTYPG